MSSYSPEAEAFLIQWTCMSLNMRSAIFRARYLQMAAERNGRQAELEAQLRQKHINAIYRQIGLEMRTLTSSDGVEKEFPEDAEVGSMGIGRFIDFRISEDAIPELRTRLEKVNRMVLTLFIALCTIHI